MFKPVKAKSISEYIALIKEPRKSQIIELDSIIQKTVPSLKPVFESNMLGYGNFHYKTKSGREGDWPVLSLASQKNYISVYVCSVTNGKYIAEEYKDKLGKVSVGKSCIRFKKIDDINLEVLKKVLIEAAKSPGFE